MVPGTDATQPGKSPEAFPLSAAAASRCYDDRKMKAARFGHAGLTLVCLLSFWTTEATAQVTAITAGTLIDPETGTGKADK